MNLSDSRLKSYNDVWLGDYHIRAATCNISIPFKHCFKDQFKSKFKFNSKFKLKIQTENLNPNSILRLTFLNYFQTKFNPIIVMNKWIPNFFITIK